MEGFMCEPFFRCEPFNSCELTVSAVRSSERLRLRRVFNPKKGAGYHLCSLTVLLRASFSVSLALVPLLLSRSERGPIPAALPRPASVSRNLAGTNPLSVHLSVGHCCSTFGFLRSTILSHALTLGFGCLATPRWKLTPWLPPRSIADHQSNEGRPHCHLGVSKKNRNQKIEKPYRKIG